LHYKQGEENMHDRTEQIEYKGYYINIYPDTDAQSPEELHDEGLFLVGYHSDFFVDRSRTKYNTETGKREVIDSGISESLAQSIFNKGKYEDGSINDEAKRYIKEYYIFPLSAYIHSGVSLYLGTHKVCQWDSSQVGLVFVKKNECKTKRKAEKLAQGLIEEWNTYLSGSIYGYMIEPIDDIEGKGEAGGCWGFYGYDHKESGLLERAEEEIDAEVKEDKRKAQIAKMAVA